MKIIQEICEVSGEGLESLLGKHVVLWCANYVYSGKLIGVNEFDVKLADAYMVFETGRFDAEAFKDAQKLPSDVHYVRTAAMESYCERGF
jgi:hypothetical protein